MDQNNEGQASDFCEEPPNVAYMVGVLQTLILPL